MPLLRFRPRRRPRLLASLLFITACNDRTIDDSATATDASTSSSSGDPSGPSTSDSSGVVEPTTDNPCTSGCVPDLPPDDCDPFAQDCAPGMKCTSDGQDTVCVPLDPMAGAPGDPCTSAGDGVDSCVAGSFCWIDDICHVFCVEPKAPCPGGQACVTADGFAQICVPTCNPLAPSCPVGQVCVIPSDDIPVCAPDVSGAGGEPGDVCEFVNGCDPGNQCDAKDTVPECAGNRCCTPFCDIGLPDPGCPPGQSCLPFFAGDTAPAGLESVGTCGVQ